MTEGVIEVTARALTQLDAMLLTGSHSASELRTLIRLGRFPEATHAASRRSRPKWCADEVRAFGYPVPEIITGSVERSVGDDLADLLEGD
ncbi:MAG: hypothetical protein AAFX81_16520 [Pseudomonadota bacterium]